METIWEGDVKNFSRAFDLICIVDQIHDYAINVHRPFVMKHLEAWHARQEKSRESEGPFPNTLRAASLGDGSGDMELGASHGENPDTSAKSTNVEDILNLMRFGDKSPEWLRLKKESREKRTDKAQMTRELNRNLRHFAQARRAMDAGPRPAQLEAANEGRKRGRGRLRKTGKKVVKDKVAKSSSGGTRRSARLRARGS